MLRKFIHIILAGFILISTTGFRINMHYCHEQLIDLALFSPAQSCCEKGTMASCKTENSINQMNHCKNESIVVESTDDYVGSTDVFSFENAPTINLLFTISILFNEHGMDNPVQKKPHRYKDPPPFKEVELSKIQTYLI